MSDDNDMKCFLEALDNMPDDVFQAKFEGSPPPPAPVKKIKPDAPYDRTIDLHGFTRREALHVLRSALTNARGKRLKFLVITGRGLNSEDGRGVIREAVLAYLKKAGSLYVREYCFASGKNGGDGAVEIYTK